MLLREGYNILEESLDLESEFEDYGKSFDEMMEEMKKILIMDMFWKVCNFV